MDLMYITEHVVCVKEVKTNTEERYGFISSHGKIWNTGPVRTGLCVLL